MPSLRCAVAPALLFLLLVASSGEATRAAAQSATPPAATPAAAPADVASVDAIITALYDVISGPKGEARNWDRMRSLFIPGGRLIPTGSRPTGGAGARLITPDEYITTSGKMIEEIGFREREIARRTEQFGNIAHVFSTYEAHQEGDPNPFLRGINSIQLFNDGTRWYIVNVFWSPESPDHPLPATYLPARKG
jgi:hypothetical protein